MKFFFYFSTFICFLSILFGTIFYFQDDSFPLIVKSVLNQYNRGVLCIVDESGKVEKYGKMSSKKNEGKNGCDATMILTNSREFYRTLVLYGGNTGLGEAYVNKFWRIEKNSDINSELMNLQKVIFHMMQNEFNRKNKYRWIIEYLFPIRHYYDVFMRYFFMKRTKSEDNQSIEHGYGIGNDFFKLFLGDELNGYTCGIFNHPSDTIRDAQLNKWNLIIKKLRYDLIPKNNNKKIQTLDMGCGWGFLDSHINNVTKSKTYGITIATDQIAFAKHYYHNQVKNNEVEYLPLDYRDVPKKFGKNYFDRIVSVGMLEHVGFQNVDKFFKIVYDSLKPDAYFVIHYISSTNVHPHFTRTTRETACQTANFIYKYIFPNACILHSDWAWQSAHENGLVLLHSETFGKHYARTLFEWRKLFVKNWPKFLKKKKKTTLDYSRLFRIYEFYFAYCEALFRAGKVDLVQQVFYKPNIKYDDEWPYFNHTIHPAAL